MKLTRPAVLVAVLIAAWPAGARGQSSQPSELDARVQAFLDGARHRWHDLNVPYEDGRVLHDLIVSRGLRRGVEIGTSTGHSGTWIAWAFSKTGGKLVTIEIDEGRHRQALANFDKAGVLPWVDARRADAHELVKVLPGPYDFVFSDADKEWYPQYFRDLDPKLVPGGCFTAHNVSRPFGAIGEFLDLVRARRDYETTIDRTSRSGISISCKKAPVSGGSLPP
jgi:predicted O-methyltransferase YrrM